MSFLRELASHPEYKKLLAAAEKMKPTVPNWEVDQTNGKDNADVWRKQSAMREGFELCLLLFTPK